MKGQKGSHPGIEYRYNKQGKLESFKFRCCVGRDEQYKQVWRTVTIPIDHPRIEGKTEKAMLKELNTMKAEFDHEQKAIYAQTHEKVDKTKITFTDFCTEHWWPDHVKDGSHTSSTISFYYNMMQDIVSYFGEKKRLKQIDAEAVKRYITYLNTEARTKDGKLYSKTTIVRHYQTLRNIFNYAIRFDYLKDDPCKKLRTTDVPQQPKAVPDFLVPEDADRFIKALDNEPLFWRTFMNVLLFCGLRRGECLGLTWGDIDQEHKVINVHNNVTADKTSSIKVNIGKTKGKEPRNVPMNTTVSLLLEEFRKNQEEKYGGKVLPSAFVFCAASDPYRPLYPSVPTRWQARFVKRHKLPNVSCHDLRHTFATLALEGGANMRDVQLLLGHKEPQTTMRFYAGVTEKKQRATVAIIEKVIEQAASGENFE